MTWVYNGHVSDWIDIKALDKKFNNISFLDLYEDESGETFHTVSFPIEIIGEKLSKDFSANGQVPALYRAEIKRRVEKPKEALAKLSKWKRELVEELSNEHDTSLDPFKGGRRIWVQSVAKDDVRSTISLLTGLFPHRCHVIERSNMIDMNYSHIFSTHWDKDPICIVLVEQSYFMDKIFVSSLNMLTALHHPMKENKSLNYPTLLVLSELSFGQNQTDLSWNVVSVLDK